MSQARGPVIQWFKRIWEGLIEPAQVKPIRERHLARVLNIVLLLLIAWGIVIEIQNRLNRDSSTIKSPLAIVMLGFLGLAYYLNRNGYFTPAIITTLGLFITADFISALNQSQLELGSPSVFYYLIIAVLLSEFFLSMKGYLITASIILAGVIGISLITSHTFDTFLFLLVFCMLATFFSYNRRFIERQQVKLAGKFKPKQGLLSTEQRRIAQLELLEEVGRQITHSLDEKEILQDTLEAVVNKFGYAEAAISLLINDQILEVAAITGTEDFGIRAGFQQKIGEGIIGHVAGTGQVYVTGDVARDPYYFSTAERNGSAMAIPILDEQQVLGVLYVESEMLNAFEPDDVQTLHTITNQVASSLQKARLYARTREHLRVMTTLQSVSDAVTSSLDLNEILHRVIRLLKDSFGYTYISIYLTEGNMLKLGVEIGYPSETIFTTIPMTNGVIGRTVRSMQTQFIPDASKDPDFLRAAHEVVSEICVPLLKESYVLGVLNVESASEVPLGDNDVALLNALAGPVSIAIDNARLHAEVKTMALSDTLTGLANRRAFDDILDREILRAQRYGHQVSLIILDLDSFKEFNDRWGHPAGDERLKEIGNLLNTNVREPDIAARYGGEEFAVILPNTSKDGALIVAERLRISAEAQAENEHPANGPIAGFTISLGVATFPDDSKTLYNLLLAADNAELNAKRFGKNRVCAANQ